MHSKSGIIITIVTVLLDQLQDEYGLGIPYFYLLTLGTSGACT